RVPRSGYAPEDDTARLSRERGEYLSSVFEWSRFHHLLRRRALARAGTSSFSSANTSLKHEKETPCLVVEKKRGGPKLARTLLMGECIGKAYRLLHCISLVLGAKRTCRVDASAGAFDPLRTLQDDPVVMLRPLPS